MVGFSIIVDYWISWPSLPIFVWFFFNGYKKGTPRFVQRFGHFILSFIRKLKKFFNAHMLSDKIKMLYNEFSTIK